MKRKEKTRVCLKRKFYFFKREEGTSALEFAILGPTFILLMLGILNIGIMMVIQNSLEAAVREASRYGVTGASQTGSTRANSIIGVINNVTSQYSGGIINTSKLVVTVSAYPDLANISSGTGQLGSFGTGGQAVLYQLSYPWDTLFNLFGSNHVVVLQAQTPVVNEQFT